MHCREFLKEIFFFFIDRIIDINVNNLLNLIIIAIAKQVVTKTHSYPYKNIIK